MPDNKNKPAQSEGGAGHPGASQLGYGHGGGGAPQEDDGQSSNQPGGHGDRGQGDQVDGETQDAD